MQTLPEELERVLSAANAVSDTWSAWPNRSAALIAVADALDASGDELVSLAGAETHLPEGRLRGELKRTTFQLRLFASEIEAGAVFDVRIDHPDPDWPMGAPRPDLRRYLRAMGPAVVFAASNFPFAFSVAGGDTASALAAGCPVILKAHSGHPELSRRTGEIVSAALAGAGVPEGVFAVIFGTANGSAALSDPRVKVGSFTGSIPGGRALFDIAASRPEPIPFYGELGSLNPTFLTPAADAERPEEIAAEFVASFTMGAGQFCTKPGVLFVPAESKVRAALESAELPGGARLLNDRIVAGYGQVLGELLDSPALSVLAGAEVASGDAAPAPTLLATDLATARANQELVFGECFGPTAVVVTYERFADLLELAEELPGQLTATVIGQESEARAAGSIGADGSGGADESGGSGVDLPALVRILARKAGRLLWNQWPTGVSVTHAQQHGGPYPATTASWSTSVGTAAIFRFLRPVAYQGFPTDLLPPALREDNPLHWPRRLG